MNAGPPVQVSPTDPAGTVTARRSANWKSLALVAAFAFVNAAAFQGSRGLYETTEGRYAECARETMLTGDWDDPVLDGHPHWSKPPLTYAAIMAGTRLCGNSPWGVRAYLVAAMVLAAAAVWWTGLSIWGPAAGRWAGVVFATSPAIAVAAHSVSADLLVALWTALTLAAFWHARTAHSRWAALGAWIFAGLGALTKGPPALLVPLATLGCAKLLLRRTEAWKPPYWTTALGLALFLAIGCGWFAEEATEHPGLFAYWIGQELVARNVTAEFNRNPGMFFVFAVYIPLLLLGTGPWLAYTLVRWRRSCKSWPWTGPISKTWTSAARWALLTGMAIPFLAFTCSRSRLAAYLTPLFVPQALLLGRGLERLLERGLIRVRTVHRLAWVLLVLIVVLKGLAAFPESAADMTRLAKRVEPILAANPATRLVSVGHRPLHGLKFHLKRDVEPLAPEHFAHRMLGSEDPHELFLVRTRQWPQLSVFVGPDFRIVQLGPHWVGIRRNAVPQAAIRTSGN